MLTNNLLNLFFKEHKTFTINPFKPDECQKTTQTLLGFLILSKDAIKAVKELQLKKFDALAGDCACHLRALKITLILQHYLFTPFGKKELDEFEQQVDQTIEKAKQPIAWDQLGKKGVYSLETLCQKFSLKVETPPPLAYLIHCYVLTLSKGYNPLGEDEHKPTKLISCQSCQQPIQCYDGVQEEVTLKRQVVTYIQNAVGHCNLLKSAIEDCVEIAKRHMSKASIAFVQDEANLTGDAKLEALLCNTNIRMLNHCPQLPDYGTLTTIMTACQIREIPLLIKFKTHSHAHRFQEPEKPFEKEFILLKSDGGTYQPALAAKCDFDKPLVVLDVKRAHPAKKEKFEDYLKRFLQYNFVHLCKLDSAQHSAYTDGSDLTSILGISQEILDEVNLLKEEATEIGCTLSNHPFFLLAHIYCDTLKNQMGQGNQLWVSTKEEEHA